MVLFGMSMGELVVIVGVGAYVFGPKELPRVGRMLGLATGRATGFLYKARAKMFRFAEDTEVTKLHAEMQATMHQLNSIREELRGGINFMNPGPLTQRTLRIKPMPGQGVIDPYTAQQTSVSGDALPSAPQPPGPPAAAAAQWAAGPSFAAAPYAAPLAQQQQAQQAQQQPQQQGAPTITVSPAMPPPPRDVSGGAAWGGSAGSSSGAVAAQHMGGNDQEKAWRPPQYVEGISAVAAGLAPERSKGMPTGSDIVLDALFEEIVAHQAAAFLQGQQQAQAQQPQHWQAPLPPPQQAPLPPPQQQAQQGAQRAGTQVPPPQQA